MCTITRNISVQKTNSSLSSKQCVIVCTVTRNISLHNIIYSSGSKDVLPFLGMFQEFDIVLTKHNGSLGFTLRKEDESVLGHYVRALVREPALSDGRIQQGDKIVAVSILNEKWIDILHRSTSQGKRPSSLMKWKKKKMDSYSS